MEKIFKERPFKVRNADEYDIANILNLFVSPTEGLITPFDYENTIIKGRMGSGKTMYLRANHAYYLSILVPSLIDRKEKLILPVFIRLNDFQHISKPEDIYRAIIVPLRTGNGMQSLRQNGTQSPKRNGMRLKKT